MLAALQFLRESTKSAPHVSGRKGHECTLAVLPAPVESRLNENCGATFGARYSVPESFTSGDTR